ncbi:MAG TPA: phosphodiester glycosidase family protein [Anaerohalosphaeraceae bacterium]|nr:phosphodiester glycosidase family protein [Anaerohalosphaeraceae bacterium]HRT51424.1 phosphodiester glycosidase family protein [Anaerohalosphaeraceae bacterium]HRT87261.1 phosphodiester glycosidase family protein [Anaerohalosphaeraceae bacterium]
MFFVVLALSAHAVPAAETEPAWPRVPAGVEYVHRRIGAVPWAIHVVKVDRSQSNLGFATALGQGRICGLETVRGQVAGLGGKFGRPVAAVNGDFFVIRPGPYQGDPTGLHIVNGELVSASRGSAFWIDVQGRPRIGEVHTKICVTGPKGFAVTVGLNQQCGDDEAVLFTQTFGESTRTSGCTDIVLEPDGDATLPLQIGGTYRRRVAAVRAGGDTPLGRGVMMLSLGAKKAAALAALAEGDVVEVSVSSSPDLAGVRTAVGGGEILIQDGKVRSWQGRLPRHPRTAIGFNSGHVFLVVVDGRQAGLSAGMTYAELAGLMAELGCTEAMNLDGGGSSTLWLGGCVMNEPSDGRERAVANSLILVDTAAGQ